MIVKIAIEHLVFLFPLNKTTSVKIFYMISLNITYNRYCSQVI